jgi:hypothetical protein
MRRCTRVPFGGRGSLAAGSPSLCRCGAVRFVPSSCPVVPSRPLRADTREGGTTGRSLTVTCGRLRAVGLGERRCGRLSSATRCSRGGFVHVHVHGVYVPYTRRREARARSLSVIMMRGRRISGRERERPSATPGAVDNLSLSLSLDLSLRVWAGPAPRSRPVTALRL